MNVRRPVPDDAEAVLALLRSADAAVAGDSDWTLSDVTEFAEFFDRGERRVGLGVDAESPSGATRLYERAGMRVLWRAVVWEKELRASG